MTALRGTASHDVQLYDIIDTTTVLCLRMKLKQDEKKKRRLGLILSHLEEDLVVQVVGHIHCLLQGGVVRYIVHPGVQHLPIEAHDGQTDRQDGPTRRTDDKCNKATSGQPNQIRHARVTSRAASQKVYR